MVRMIRLLLVSLVVAGALVAAGAVGASAHGDQGDQSTAQVNVLHEAYGAGTVDVYVNGVKAISGLEEGDSTGFFALPEGTYQLEVKKANTSTTLLSGVATVEGGESYTVTATLGGLVIDNVTDNDAEEDDD